MLNSYIFEKKNRFVFFSKHEATNFFQWDFLTTENPQKSKNPRKFDQFSSFWKFSKKNYFWVRYQIQWLWIYILAFEYAVVSTHILTKSTSEERILNTESDAPEWYNFQAFWDGKNEKKNLPRKLDQFSSLWKFSKKKLF